MKNLQFNQIKKDNEEQCQLLLNMWIPYFNEISKNPEGTEELIKYARQRVNIQGKRDDMHFELCYLNDIIIGFCFYAVDLGGIKNIIDPNYGYIMEFYVLPQYRRKGFGRIIYEHIEKTFSDHGAKYIYLTPEENNGEPFWLSLGFVNCGKIDPDNLMPILIKKIEYFNN